jgi:putative membrane protein
MKRTLIAVLTLSLALSAAGLAAQKKSKKSTGPRSTLPPTSPMIVVPPSDPAITSSEPAKLISSEMSGNDLQFFTTAVEAGRFQAYLGELLRDKAESEQIKALGAALFDMQENENKQISRVAASKGWTVSTQPTVAQRTSGAELEKQTGSLFDKAVMDKLIAASQQAVSAYEAASKSTDRDIKTFSEQMLPMAQEKLRLAEKMTGAGKAAGQLFRTGAPPKPVPAATPPAILPSKGAPAAKPPKKPAADALPVATPKPASAPATPGTIPPPVTN